MRKALLILVILAAGCETPSARRLRTQDTVSHFAAPDPGQRGAPSSSLTGRGDFGVGLLADGRPFVVNGASVFCMEGQATVRAVESTATVSSVTLTHFEPDLIFDVENVDRGLFERALRLKGLADDAFFSVRLRGVFREVLVADADRPANPGITIAGAGTLSGFHAPRGSLPGRDAGYELYFVDEAGRRGGRVLGMNLARGRIEVDPGCGIKVLRHRELAGRAALSTAP
jgi:alpha-acetolactate decarboxylase